MLAERRSVQIGFIGLGTAFFFAMLALRALPALSAEDLAINPKLDYKSDSNDGPLIYGKNLNEAVLHAGKPAHILFTGRA